MAIYGSNYDYGDSHYKDEGGEEGGELFYFLPNWKFPVKVSYGFKTPISVKRRKGEQRKPLRKYPIRSHEFTVTTKDDFEKIWNYLMNLHASNLFIPIYSEPCRPLGKGSLAGVNVIEVISDIMNYYNLRNWTEYLLAIDLRKIEGSEILLYSDVVGQYLIISDAIVGDFQRETTIIYPLFYCYLTKNERSEYSDRMTKINLEFTEYK